MIKEYIESLPGGKDFILAEQRIGMAYGALFMGIVPIAIGFVNIVHPNSGMLTKDDVLAIFIEIDLFVAIVFIIVGIIVYYYKLNKADNSYMSKKSSDKS